MGVILHREMLKPSHPWTIRVEQQSIPVRYSGYRRQEWVWPSGEIYLMDMNGEYTIYHNEEVVAKRKVPAWGSVRGHWEGHIALAYTWRSCSVWFRDGAGKLVMWARSRCFPGPYSLVIRDSIRAEVLPVLSGIAMATFLNYER